MINDCDECEHVREETGDSWAICPECEKTEVEGNLVRRLHSLRVEQLEEQTSEEVEYIEDKPEFVVQINAQTGTIHRVVHWGDLEEKLAFTLSSKHETLKHLTGEMDIDWH